MARLERISERAFVLPIVAFLLFVPPIVTLFDGTVRVAGIPLILLYLFGVWLLLIAAARHLGHRLLVESQRRRGSEGTSSGGAP